ncbi:cytochrome c oxidase copper chaperone [Harmonia axyridis]|uniref:cytochrome c oxidase copper chaperone n=1 Tax=Harmonia axyridis TaxID=115357 RepID=UPI001E2795FA|nr:cytochrome c oxidase copper chaperone [Harmonia axyridis]
MGNANQKVEAAAPVKEITNQTQLNDEQPKKLKPCCACPETKRVRDACIIENGEENCRHLIEAHKECMRKAGFNI